MPKPNNTQVDTTLLVSIIERVERLNQDISNLSADIKEIYSEARSNGFDPKYIKQMIKLRAKDPDELNEEDELTKMYRRALAL
jgi:uncharacterized protein (UPF0335 family)